MTDTIVKGSGNSRKLITVPNAPTLYPDHETLMQKWATEGIPVDIGPLLAIGCDVIGTMLNKANVLTDATEKAIWGNAANRTPDAALAQLRSLITTAQSSADSKAKYSIGSFTSTKSAQKITTGFPPKLVVIVPYQGGISSDNCYLAVYVSNYGGMYATYSSGTHGSYLYQDTITTSSDGFTTGQANQYYSGTFSYLAIG